LPTDAAHGVWPREAARHLRATVEQAVLAGTGHRARRPGGRTRCATPRDVEVLVLIARAATTRQIVRRLGLPLKTAGNQIEGIYPRTGRSTHRSHSVINWQRL
jgi:DNA-binding NarL/FixJ family response regulator